MLRHAASYGVKSAAVAFDRVRAPQRGITVLLYHRTGAGTGSLVDLEPTTFAAQLAYLADHAEVITLDDAAERLRTGHSGNDLPTVVLTFDDGTVDFTDQTVPLLVRYGLPATLYVATAFVDEGRTWPDGCPSASWAGLRDALATGLVSIGSHTHEHRLLDRAPLDEVSDDLDRSIELIGDELGVEARHFAYPKALAPRADIEALVRARFVTAALAGNRANVAGAADLHLLGRTPVQTTDAGPFFRQKVAGGMRAEADLREVANRIRYRGAAQ